MACRADFSKRKKEEDGVLSMKESYQEFSEMYLKKLEKVISGKSFHREIVKSIPIFERFYSGNGCIYVCGNGGSASTSNHFVADLNNIGIKAISLASNVADITRIANDFGYEDIFWKQLENNLNLEDLVVCISASGNSQNVIKAAEFANSQNVATLSLTGFDGGKLLDVSRYSIHIDTKQGEYGIVEDSHIIACHLIANYFHEK